MIKISGETLAGGGAGAFDRETPRRVAREIFGVMESGAEVAVVVGGGNLWRGRDASPSMDKIKADQIGMMATVMNGIFLADTFRSETGGRSVVMTPFDINNFTSRFSVEEAVKLLREKVLPVFAGGTGHPFFSTDSAVAIRACELQADAVLFGKSVDGVYDDDPKINPGARRYRSVSYKTVLSKNLEVADISAMALLAKENIPSFVFGLKSIGGIAAACAAVKGEAPFDGAVIGADVPDEFYAD
jgi:uridylate kinase